MNNKKTIGIIGCGTVTLRNYVPAFKRIDGIRTSFVYDTNEGNSKQVARLLGAELRSPDYIYKNSDFVVIATPPSTHFGVVKQGLTAGCKNIVCEKPFLANAGEAGELIALADSVKANLFVAHFRRCYPSVNLARRISKSGVLGELKSVDIVEGGRFSWPTKSDYVTKDPFGGVLFDTGSHTIDMALYSSGLDDDKLRVAVGTVERDKPEPSHEIQSHFRLVCERNEIRTRVHLSRYLDLSNRIRLDFENGRLEFSTELQNKIRLSKVDRSSLIFSKENFRDAMDSFAFQYYQIFNSIDAKKFDARRFVTLTSILEQVSSSG